MDVRRWLEETKTPGPPASLGLPAGQHAREGAPRDAAKQSSPNRRKCKRPQRHTSSDSSLLWPDRANGHGQPVTQKSGNEDRARQHTASDKTASHYSSELSGSADRSEFERYARRPRRKTRPEIYEPKAGKKRSKRTHGSRKDRHAPLREKDRRRTRPRQSDLAQTFHAKNVAKDRLTLKPSEGLGLFKKGRASSPVKGRGLPDLVFSEMRFLQKQSEPVGSRPANETSSKRKKTDISVGQEDEISTYFAAQRPAFAENNVNLLTLKRPERLPENERHNPHDITSSSLESTSAEGPANLPKRPYLGFGTRRVGSTASSETTYIPWSNSGRHKSATAPQRSPGRSPPLQVGAEEDNGTQSCPSNVAVVSNHDAVRLDASGNRPRKLARPRAAQSKTTVGTRHGAVSFQSEARDDQSLPINVLRTESPIPPSSHKHRTDKHRQRVTDVSPSQVLLQQEEHTTGTDVNKQRGRRPSDAQTNNQARLAALQAAGDRAVHNNGNAVMAQGAIEVTSDATRMRGPQRSSSPLGKLLRQCDDACHDPPVAHARREFDSIDMQYAKRSVELEDAGGRLETHRSAMAAGWAGEIAETHPVLYQMQAQDAAAACGGSSPRRVAIEDVRMPDSATDAIESEEYEYLDDVTGMYLVRDRSEGPSDEYIYHDDYGGSMCDIGLQGGEEEYDGGRLAGFWRPHKLY